jgi:hypothetical protein
LLNAMPGFADTAKLEGEILCKFAAKAVGKND